MQHQLSHMHQAKRCRAKSKRSGKPCQSPAVRGRTVCRMHGAGGGAPRGNRNAYKHGRYTAEALAQRRWLRELLRESRALSAKV
jgi:glucans biosynthesis protein